MLPNLSPRSLPGIPNLEAVAKIIKKIATEEILTRYNRLKSHEVSDKASGEIVTAADVQSEYRLVEELTTLMPDSTVVGEEGFNKDKSIMARFDGDVPVWILDPLDGTRNFSEGNPRFCIIVAYCFKKTTYIGWIYDPLNDDMLFAAKGMGAWYNNKPISLQGTPKLSDMIGSVGKQRREYLNSHYGSRNKEVPRQLLRYRCIGLEYIDLIRGHLHFAEYEYLKPWDHAAGILLHQEAGGYSAYTETLCQYVPGPASSKKFVAAQSQGNWQEICDFLLV